MAVRRHFRGPRRLFWPRLGGSLLAHLLLPFQTLGQTDALPVELVDVAAVGEPVQQGCRQGSIAKDPASIRQRPGWRSLTAKPSRNDSDLIQQLRSCFRERDVAELIEDDQVKAIELSKHSLQLFFLPGLHQRVDQALKHCKTQPGGRAGRPSTPSIVAACVLPVPCLPIKATFSLSLIQVHSVSSRTSTTRPVWANNARSRLLPAFSSPESAHCLQSFAPADWHAAARVAGSPDPARSPHNCARVSRDLARTLGVISPHGRQPQLLEVILQQYRFTGAAHPLLPSKALKLATAILSTRRSVIPGISWAGRGSMRPARNFPGSGSSAESKPGSKHCSSNTPGNRFFHKRFRIVLVQAQDADKLSSACSSRPRRSAQPGEQHLVILRPAVSSTGEWAGHFQTTQAAGRSDPDSAADRSSTCSWKTTRSCSPIFRSSANTSTCQQLTWAHTQRPTYALGTE